MFSNTYLPPLISLFSSTSSLPLQLFSQHTDLSLKEDSLIHLLNDSTSLPSLAGGVLIEAPAIMSTEEEREDIRKDAERSGEEKREGKTLCQTVLHIQSPTLRTTFIRCPPLHTRSSAAGELGITLPWIHLQVRNLGREWSFEVGITDREGKKGVIRCSTFQVSCLLRIRVGDICFNFRTSMIVVLSSLISPFPSLITLPYSEQQGLSHTAHYHSCISRSIFPLPPRIP